MKTKLTKPIKKDLQDFVEIKKQSLEDYSKLAGEKIRISKEKIEKEFLDSIKNKNIIFLLLKENKQIVGYIVGNIIKKSLSSRGYIDDVFVLKSFRRKGLAKKLIKEFSIISKKRRVKIIRLGVRVNNQKAIKLYKKLGFEIKHYEMDKRI